MSVPAEIKCPKCNGVGVVKRNDNGEAITCPRCMGTGKIRNPGYNPTGYNARGPQRF